METYSRAAVERAMKIQEVILRAVAKKITWTQAGEIIGLCERQKTGHFNLLTTGRCAAFIVLEDEPTASPQGFWHDRQQGREPIVPLWADQSLRGNSTEKAASLRTTPTLKRNFVRGIPIASASFTSSGASRAVLSRLTIGLSPAGHGFPW